jgi:hypothetical protein
MLSNAQAVRREHEGDRLIPSLNLAGLGYREYSIYLRLAGNTLSAAETIKNNLSQLADVGGITLLNGRWDAVISFYAISLRDLNRIRRRILCGAGQVFERRVSVAVNSSLARLSCGTQTAFPALTEPPVNFYTRSPSIKGLQRVRSLHSFCAVYQPQLRTVLFDEHDRRTLRAISCLPFESLKSLAEVIGTSELLLEKSIYSLERKGILCGWTYDRHAAETERRWLLQLQIPACKGLRTKFCNFCRTDEQVERIAECIGPWNTAITVRASGPTELSLFKHKLQMRLHGHIAISSVSEIITECHITPFLRLRYPGDSVAV